MKKIISSLLNKQWELAYVGYVKKGEIAILDGPFTSWNNNYVIIPPEILMKLIIFCIENKVSPFIIHNHVNNCYFSIPDMNFLYAFKKMYIKKGGANSIVIGLVNSTTGQCKINWQKVRKWNEEVLFEK